VGESTGETTEQASETGDQPPAAPPEPDPPAAVPPPRSRPHAATRQQALALLDQVAAYYRAAEPTSPVPVLIERARSLAGRDFMSLLKDFLPEAALRTIVPEDRS
jgi:type VI secretion system protein ImpA